MGSSGVNFSGLGSGIDTESIISQYLALERRPLAVLQNSQLKIRERQTAYNTVSAQLLGLQAATQSLDRLRAFELVSASSSSADAVDVTAQTGAQVGSHAIAVAALARGQIVGSRELTSKTDALGFSGQIVVNGKAVSVAAADTLETLAASINSANAGVTASIISPSAGKFYLTLGSKNTGLQGRLALSDVGGGNLLGGTLGIFGAGTSLRNPVSGSVAGSGLFRDSGTSLGTLMGLTAPPSGTVSITSGGVTRSVALDLGADTLSGVAARINTAFGSSVSSVVAVTDPITGESRQQLQISGVSGAGDLVDANNVLASLGVVQRGYDAGRELTAAQDAAFTIDGLTASRPTNTISDAISGVTFTLKKDGGAASTLTVGEDYEAIKGSVRSFVEAFNRVVDTIGSAATYDAQTGRTGPLFADNVTNSILDNIVSAAINAVPGLSGEYTALSSAGITLDTQNRLVLNEAALETALRDDIVAVGRLFRASGETTNSQVQFVTTSADTQASPPTGYAISVLTAARQAVVTAGSAYQTLTGDETLTFGGALFGSPKTLTLRAGATLADAISQINGDAAIGKQVTASDDGGRLRITSKAYGTKAAFTFKSAIPNGPGTSGVGNVEIAGTGVDVAGTINGEAATGEGQFLTGSQRGTTSVGNGKALGLQVRITGTTPGGYGVITVSTGAANLMRNYVTTQSDPFSGGLSTSVEEMQDNIDDIDETVKGLEERLKEREANLRRRFLAMESSLSRIRAAGSGLSQLASLSQNQQKK